MPYVDKKQYKNPAIPKASGVLPTYEKASRAPARGPGIMQMNAAAEARQPKKGTPPIPDTGAPAHRQQAAEGMLARDAGPAPRADTRAQAAKSLFDKSVAGAPPVTPMAAPVGAVYSQQQPAGYVVPMMTPAQMQQGLLAPVQGASIPTGMSGAQKPGSQTKPEAEEGEGPLAPLGGVFAAMKQLQEEGPTPPVEVTTGDDGQTYIGDLAVQATYDENGNFSGYVDADGGFYGKDGARAGDVPGGHFVSEEHPKKAQIEFYKQIKSWLGEKTGISDAELDSMLTNIENQGIDQMHRVSQQLAARGLGRSGMLGVGMGQAYSQMLSAMLDTQFKTKEFNATQQAQKFQTVAAMYSGMMSDDAKKYIAEMKDKFDAEQVKNQKLSEWRADFSTEVLGNFLETRQADPADGLEAKVWAFYSENVDKYDSVEELIAAATAKLGVRDSGKKDSSGKPVLEVYWIDEEDEEDKEDKEDKGNEGDLTAEQAILLAQMVKSGGASRLPYPYGPG